jgi:hypothetical protein
MRENRDSNAETLPLGSRGKLETEEASGRRCGVNLRLDSTLTQNLTGLSGEPGN